MPQNKFYGYENSAFQAGKHPGIQKYSSQSKFSIHRLTIAWKAITFITAGHDLRTKTSLPLLPERQNHCSCTDEYPCRRKANIRLPVFEPSWRINVLPSRQGDSCRFIPQNKFCGYENSAFQAGKHPGIQKYSSQWKPSIHRLTFAWKAKTFITAGHDLRTKTSLPLLPERQNIRIENNQLQTSL